MGRDRRRSGLRAGPWLVAAAVALGTVGVALGQGAARGPQNNNPAGAKAARGKARVPARGPQRKAPNAADPLAAKAKDAGAPKGAGGGSFHYRLKVQSLDDTTLAASYYPGRLDTSTPVVMLVHEKDRSAKDFEDPIADLKGKGLAEHLQSVGYAVFAFDLRGHGANVRRGVSDRDWPVMMDDLQAAYLFLLDRHNRGDLNVARLGVVALGEGANLAAAWAYQPGGAVSSEGRVTDVAGLALVSPLPEGAGYSFPTLMNALAPRIPVLLMAGERDAPSHDVVKRVRANVEKTRQNRVEMFPSSLHGYKLLRLEPKATTVLAKFLEGTVKLKAVDWEPRYNLTPVTYNDIQIVRHTKTADAAKDAPKAKGKAAEKGKEKAKEEKDQDGADAKEAPKAKGEAGAGKGQPDREKKG